MRSGDSRGIDVLFWTLWVAVLCIANAGCSGRPAAVPICKLQGEDSPYLGQELFTEGVVYGFREPPGGRGFFVQEVDCDRDLATTDGLVVHAPDHSVQVGDEVRLRGVLEEGDSQQVFRLSKRGVEILSVSHILPEPVGLDEVIARGEFLEHWTRWRGMLVNFHGGRVAGVDEQEGLAWIAPAGSGPGHPQAQPAPLVCITLNHRPEKEFPHHGDRLERVSAALEGRSDGPCLCPLQPLRWIRKGAAAVEEQEVQESREMAETVSPDIILPSIDPILERWLTLSTPVDTREPLPAATPTPYPATLLISEVFPNPQGEEPGGEWIEIYNPEGFGRELTNYKIGDAENPHDREGMLAFPPGYYIEKGEVLVIANRGDLFRENYGLNPDFEIENTLPSVPDLWKYGGWGGSNILLGNSGDEVLLLDWKDRVIDSLAYGGSNYAPFQPAVPAPAEGHSLERYPPRRDKNRAADWRERKDPSPGRLDRTPPTITPTPSPSPSPSFTPSPTPTGPTPTPVPVQLLISEVLANPVGPEPDGEWMELYNPHPYPVPLGEVKIGDAAHAGDPEGMMAFPSGRLVAPGGVIVVANRASAFHSRFGFLPDFEMAPSHDAVPDMIRHSPWGKGSLRLRNAGDEVLLLGPGDFPVDALAYGDSDYGPFQPPVEAAGEGRSLQRYPPVTDTDAAGDWRVSQHPSPGSLDQPTPTPPPTSTATLTPSETPTPTPVPVTLLISEFLSDPAGPDTRGEWIEIYNPAQYAVPLDGVKLGDAARPGDREGMLAFPAGAVIDSGEVVVIAHDGAWFGGRYGVLPDFEMRDTHPGVPDMQPYVPWAGSWIALRNRGDEVLILDGRDRVVDLVGYGDSDHPAFQPPVERPAPGHSLERFPPHLDHDQRSDWREQTAPSPGSLNWNAFTPTPSPTRTNIPALTPTGSAMPSATPTRSPTPSPTPTESSTPTLPPSISPRPTGSATPTLSFSATLTPTGTVIPTVLPTSTLPPPGTPTKTITPVPSPTISPTPTPLPLVIILNEIHADPHPTQGDANGDGIRDAGDDEFLELVNVSGAALDLSGWTVYDGVGMRHRVPEGTVLADRCPLVLFGGGSPTGAFGGSVVQSAGFLGLNNAGDVVSVYDHRGRLRVYYAYGAEANHDQSLTRHPDLVGPFVKHKVAEEDRRFSPGVQTNGAPFGGCP